MTWQPILDAAAQVAPFGQAADKTAGGVSRISEQSNTNLHNSRYPARTFLLF